MVCFLADGTWASILGWMTMRERCASLKMVEVPEISVAALREVKDFIGPLCCTRDMRKIRANKDQKEAREHESRQEDAVGSDLDRGGLLGGSARSDPSTATGADAQAAVEGGQQRRGE